MLSSNVPLTAYPPPDGFVKRLGECETEAPILYRRIIKAQRLSGNILYSYDVLGPVLTRALSTGLRNHEKEFAARFLFEFGCPTYPEMQNDLLRIAQDHVRFRLVAFTCLSACSLAGMSDAVPILIQGMKDSNPAICEAAFGAVRMLGKDLATECVPTLQECLVAELPSTQSKALATLAWLGPEAKSAVTAVIKIMLEDPEKTIRAEAAKTLSAIDPEFVCAEQYFQETVEDESKIAILKTLKVIGPPATSLRHVIERKWSSPPSEAKPRNENGPTETGYFIWSDIRHPIPPKQWRLLHSLYGNGSVSIESIGEEVYPGEDEIEGKLKKLKSDTDARLLKLKLPFEITSPMTGHYEIKKLRLDTPRGN